MLWLLEGASGAAASCCCCDLSPCYDYSTFTSCRLSVIWWWARNGFLNPFLSPPFLKPQTAASYCQKGISLMRGMKNHFEWTLSHPSRHVLHCQNEIIDHRCFKSPAEAELPWRDHYGYFVEAMRAPSRATVRSCLKKVHRPFNIEQIPWKAKKENVVIKSFK